MDAKERNINTFTTRVRQMILQYQEVKRENAELYTMVDERDAKIYTLEKELRDLQYNFDSLKMAKMLEVTDGDLEVAKKRVAKLIRDVNKCITLVSENNEM